MTQDEFKARIDAALTERLAYWKSVLWPKGEAAVRECIICRFDTEEDDCVVSSKNTNRTVCLRCFTREIEDTRLLSKGLRREVTLAMGE